MAGRPTSVPGPAPRGHVPVQRKTLPTGIRIRHARSCERDGSCRCCSYEAFVSVPSDRRKLRKTFSNLSEAKAWRRDALSAVARHELRAPSSLTVRDAWGTWFDEAEAGVIRGRGGSAYKPSVLRSYSISMEKHVLPELGALKIGEVRRSHVQALADRLVARGRHPSTIKNAVMPLRVLYRHAIRREVVSVNPTTGLDLPASSGRRDRIASPEEAKALLALLDPLDAALWATAFFAGLRCGELMALRWEDVDLAAGLIRVQRSYDPKARQFIAPKSKAGLRRVPIPTVLKRYLMAVRCPSGLVFGGEEPFDRRVVVKRTLGNWAAAAVGAFLRGMSLPVELEPIGLHEARHTYASLMIDAGVNAKALSEFLGHASVAITLDRYGHLMPGAHGEAAALLDAYLAERLGAHDGAHVAQVAQPSLSTP
jgi:integrase